MYIPVFIYWIWLIIQARSAFFFSAANPTIENGGMLGESKVKIFDLIDDELKPITILFDPSATSAIVLEKLRQHNIHYPFILKPDIGERGSFVEKIENQTDLSNYLKLIKVPFLAQEFIDFKIELGIFYYRYPNQQNGKVSSIVMKEFLSVVGDGVGTLEELIKANPRAVLHLDQLVTRWGPYFKKVLPAHEELILVPIGNHSRGTTFLNANHLINDQLSSIIDKMAKSINGFYFGRIDIRCKSFDDLYKGSKMKILELNGAGSEPGHIYHPGTSLWQAYKSIFHHLNVLLKISKQNHRLGIPYMSFREGIREIAKLRAYNNIKNR